MLALQEKGEYSITMTEKAKLDKDFYAGYATEDDMVEAMYDVFEEYGYPMDTHTGVALYCASKFRYYNDENMVTVSTASPYKFAKDVLAAVGGEADGDEFAPLYALNELTGVEIPAPLATLKDKTVRFTNVISPDEMAEETLKILS
jgi:threonine synthase